MREQHPAEQSLERNPEQNPDSDAWWRAAAQAAAGATRMPLPDGGATPVGSCGADLGGHPVGTRLSAALGEPEGDDDDDCLLYTPDRAGLLGLSPAAVALPFLHFGGEGTLDGWGLDGALNRRTLDAAAEGLDTPPPHPKRRKSGDVGRDGVGAADFEAVLHLRPPNAAAKDAACLPDPFSPGGLGAALLGLGAQQLGLMREFDAAAEGGAPLGQAAPLHPADVGGSEAAGGDAPPDTAEPSPGSKRRRSSSVASVQEAARLEEPASQLPPPPAETAAAAAAVSVQGPCLCGMLQCHHFPTPFAPLAPPLPRYCFQSIWSERSR